MPYDPNEPIASNRLGHQRAQAAAQRAAQRAQAAAENAAPAPVAQPTPRPAPRVADEELFPDVDFERGAARRPQPVVADPVLQWSIGLETTDRRIYAGWLCEVGKSPALDEAMAVAGFPQVTIKHGSGNRVTHWALETANLYVIADGVQSISQMQSTEERWGIAFGWRTLQGGRQQSQIRFRALVAELVEAGYIEPLLVSAKGTITGDIINALARQFEVLDAVAAFRKAAGKPERAFPLYACSIPLGPGQDVTRGQGAATKTISPVVANIPQPVSREYILARWMPGWLVPVVEGMVDETILWSEANSRQIAAGEDLGQSAPAWDGRSAAWDGQGGWE